MDAECLRLRVCLRLTEWVRQCWRLQAATVSSYAHAEGARWMITV